ncbi:MAG: hypothetical protein SVX38_02960 [Chloroflexota bacterium]|nr:hypothetical protein [Chloroflexota bacterium]
MSSTPTSPASQHTHKYPCSQCGAELDFDPAEDSLVCKYCGNVVSIPTTKAEIKEHRLEEGILAEQSEGWGTETKSYKCKSCMATVAVESSVTSTECPFCGSNQVFALEESSKVIKPESLIPFKVDQNTAVTKFRKWLGAGWFRPNALKQIASGAQAQLRGIYLPFWTFDALTSSWWEAEAGYYYYETERYTVVEDGKQVTKTRQVRKVRWEPASGAHRQFFDDVLVYATPSADDKILQKIYPFETKALIPYDPAYLSGWAAEEYRIPLNDGWTRAQEIISDEVRSACAQKVPGDTQRNLTVDTAYANVTYKHVLFPVWLASYRYSGKVYHFMVNGQTGEVQGEAPISWIKVLIAIVIAIIIIACIVGGLSILSSLGGGASSLLLPLV